MSDVNAIPENEQPAVVELPNDSAGAAPAPSALDSLVTAINVASTGDVTDSSNEPSSTEPITETASTDAAATVLEKVAGLDPEAAAVLREALLYVHQGFTDASILIGFARIGELRSTIDNGE